MGAPPAPAYATLYYGVHEMDTLLPTCQDRPGFYFRYIDDGLGAWIPHPHPPTDAALWKSFQEATPFGRLTWTFSPRQSTVNFLDLSLRIHPDDGSIRSRLYEKELNLYLYLPPHSAHPPGILRGFVIGMICRIYTLTTDPSDRRNDIRNLYLRLRNRGYRRDALLPIFEAAFTHVKQKLRAKRTIGPRAITPHDVPDTPADRVLLHLPYSALDPSRRSIQRLFRNYLSDPTGEPRLTDLRNHEDFPCPTKRLVVAYHRQPNLQNVLFPRRLPSSDPVHPKVLGHVPAPIALIPTFLPNDTDDEPPEPPEPHVTSPTP
jgi:hypothetical protein